MSIYAIGVSPEGLAALGRVYGQVVTHTPGQIEHLDALRSALQSGQTLLAAPSALVPAVATHLIEVAPGQFIAAR